MGLRQIRIVNRFNCFQKRIHEIWIVQGQTMPYDTFVRGEAAMDLDVIQRDTSLPVLPQQEPWHSAFSILAHNSEYFQRKVEWMHVSEALHFIEVVIPVPMLSVRVRVKTIHSYLDRLRNKVKASPGSVRITRFSQYFLQGFSPSIFTYLVTIL